MVDEQRCEGDLNDHAINAAARRQPSYKAVFEKLVDGKREENQLLVNFVNRWEERQAEDENEPDDVDPVDVRPFAVEHFSRDPRPDSSNLDESNTKTELALQIECHGYWKLESGHNHGEDRIISAS